MNKQFEQIAKIQNLVAAVFVDSSGTVRGWCANNTLTEDTLRFVALNCRSILDVARAEQRAAHTGAVAFADNTLVFRESRDGIFAAYLSTPVNDAVVEWLFTQVSPLLQELDLQMEIKP